MLELLEGHNVFIKVTSNYLDSLSHPLKKDFVFNYTVTIFNSETSDIQILGKTLYFRDGRKNEFSIHSDEVNDEQAWIAAGDIYECTEFHTMRTTTGNLRGALLVRVIETDSLVEIDIPLTFFRIIKNEELISLQGVGI